MDFNVHGDNNVYMGNCPNSNTQMLGAGQELHVDIKSAGIPSRVQEVGIS